MADKPTPKKKFSKENAAGDPFNFSRKIFHLIGLIIPVLIYIDIFRILFPGSFQFPTPSIAFYILGTIVLLFTIIEILRFNFEAWQRAFIKVAGKLLKEKEYNRVHASLPYALGLGICISFYPPDIAILSVLCLTVGDPAAAFVGGKWGSHRFTNGKSLEGMFGGIFGSFFAGMIAMGLVTFFSDSTNLLPLYTKEGVWQLSTIAIILLGAVFAFIFEFFSRDGLFDDNLSIPAGAGLIMTLVTGALHGNLLQYFMDFYTLVTPL